MQHSADKVNTLLKAKYQVWMSLNAETKYKYTNINVFILLSCSNIVYYSLLLPTFHGKTKTFFAHLQTYPKAKSNIQTQLRGKFVNRKKTYMNVW